MGSPVTGADHLVAPGLIHGHEHSSRLRRVQCHLGAAFARGKQQRKVMYLPAEPSAFVLRCYCELTEGPSMRLAKKINLGLGFGWPESDRCDNLPINFADEAVTKSQAVGSVFFGLMSSPIAQAICCVRGICRPNEPGEGGKVLGG